MVTKARTILLYGLGIPAMVGGGLAIASHSQNRVIENPFKVKEVAWTDASYFNYAMGNSQRPIIDVTGDGRPDSALLYEKGHAFYADGNIANNLGMGQRIICRRIYPGTPEAERLQKARPDFRLMLPPKM